VRAIGTRFVRVSKPVLPERRERVRDVASIVQEIPEAAMLYEELAASMPPMPEAAVAPVDEPADHPESCSPIDVGLAPAVVSAEQHPKQPLMTDIIKLPEHIYLKARELPSDQRLKLAGQLAAEVLKRFPHLVQQLGSTNDPVPAWTILRNVVMRQLEQHLVNELSPARHAL
jgi:hypothetical protein